MGKKVTVIATGFESAKKGLAKETVKPVGEKAEASFTAEQNDDNSGLFKNEYVDATAEAEPNGDGISDSDFNDILTLFKKN